MNAIRVNKAQWEAASEEDRNHIIAELRSAGAIQSDDWIVGDDDAPPFGEAEMTSLATIMAGNPACEAACTASYNAASRACGLIPHPAGRAACYAAAMAAYAVCLRNCV
jgi:hypothetical protein